MRDEIKEHALSVGEMQYIKRPLKKSEIDNINDVIKTLTDNMEKAGFFAGLKNMSSLRQSSLYYNELIQESIYPHGYINNLIDGTKLDNSNLNIKQSEIINLNNYIKGNQNFSNENDIDKYDNKPSNTEKYNKNYVYKINFNLNANDFPNNKYLKKFIGISNDDEEDDQNIEIVKDNEFDKNKNNNNNNYNYNNEDLNKNSIEKDDYDNFLDNIIKQNKENDNEDYNNEDYNNEDNNNENNNNENLAFIEKPNNVNGNDYDVDFDA